MVPGSRLGGLVSGIHTVFHRHIQKPARLSDYGLYHFNNRPDYFSCTGRNPCRYSLNFIVIYKKINYMQRITNNISANLTSTQATEKAIYTISFFNSWKWCHIASIPYYFLHWSNLSSNETNNGRNNYFISHVVTILNRLLFCLLLPLS